MSSAEQSSAEQQVTVDADTVRRAAVLGSPVAHSLSPALHRAGYAAAGLTGWRYDRIECDAQQLPAVVAGAGPEWAGFSVTMPGKAAAAAVADQRSARVVALGVANTLVRGPDGWFAENTDVDGVTGALRAAGLTTPRTVLLLGGGGTAAAAVAALIDLGATDLIVAGRRPQSTGAVRELGGRLGVTVTAIGWSRPEIANAAHAADLVVSTVPAGAADPLADVLAEVPALFDVVYHPWPTPLAAAGAPGRITVTGLDLLLHQAFRQFELLTGRPAPAAAMRKGLRDAAATDLPLPI